MVTVTSSTSAPTSTSTSLPRSTADRWASWFRALGDPTRVLILHALASAHQPLTVGELTARLDVGQSTVSHHLAKLAEVRFVLVENVAASSLWSVNDECFALFPSAAEVVMGNIPADFPPAEGDPDD